MKKLPFFFFIFLYSISNQAQIIIAFVGTGEAGFSGDRGPATSAQLNFPRKYIY